MMKTSNNFDQYELDRAKTRVLKYILYQRRATNEVKEKFADEIDDKMLEYIIEYFTEQGYLNDVEFVRSKFEYYMAISSICVNEIKVKLLKKGIPSDLIDNYISENEEKLYNYELESCKKNIKKKSGKEQIKIKQYLYQKGYRTNIINTALEEEENVN